jgi:hypothetical protein
MKIMAFDRNLRQYSKLLADSFLVPQKLIHKAPTTACSDDTNPKREGGHPIKRQQSTVLRTRPVQTGRSISRYRPSHHTPRARNRSPLKWVAVELYDRSHSCNCLSHSQQKHLLFAARKYPPPPRAMECSIRVMSGKREFVLKERGGEVHSIEAGQWKDDRMCRGHVVSSNTRGSELGQQRPYEK